MKNELSSLFPENDKSENNSEEASSESKLLIANDKQGLDGVIKSDSLPNIVNLDFSESEDENEPSLEQSVQETVLPTTEDKKHIDVPMSPSGEQKQKINDSLQETDPIDDKKAKHIFAKMSSKLRKKPNESLEQDDKISKSENDNIYSKEPQINKNELNSKVIKKDLPKGSKHKTVKLNKNQVAGLLIAVTVLLLAFNNILGGTDKTKPTEEEDTFVETSAIEESEDDESYEDIEPEETDETEANDSDITPTSSTYSEDEAAEEIDETEENIENFNENDASTSTVQTQAQSAPTNLTSSYPSNAGVKQSNNAQQNSSFNPKPDFSVTPKPEVPPNKPLIKPNNAFLVAPAKIEISIGDSKTITPTKSCYFVTSDSTIAVVEVGKIKGLAKGKCVITAKTKSGESFDIQVVVNE